MTSQKGSRDGPSATASSVYSVDVFVETVVLRLAS
jgi:hypothetical protein